MVVSNEILLEYREIVEQRSRHVRWSNFEAFLETIRQLHGNVIQVAPQFRFGVIAPDPDDNKFVDCAIVGEAEFIVTHDRHFQELANAGYKPLPITADALAAELK